MSCFDGRYITGTVTDEYLAWVEGTAERASDAAQAISAHHRRAAARGQPRRGRAPDVALIVVQSISLGGTVIFAVDGGPADGSRCTGR